MYIQLIPTTLDDIRLDGKWTETVTEVVFSWTKYIHHWCYGAIIHDVNTVQMYIWWNIVGQV
jgi:hypothetical protein